MSKQSLVDLATNYTVYPNGRMANRIRMFNNNNPHNNNSIYINAYNAFRNSINYKFYSIRLHLDDVSYTKLKGKTYNFTSAKNISFEIESAIDLIAGISVETPTNYTYNFDKQTGDFIVNIPGYNLKNYNMTFNATGMVYPNINMVYTLRHIGSNSVTV